MATKHPIWPEVTIQQAMALCKADGNAAPTRDQLQEKYNWLHQAREKKIHNEVNDPLQYGWRPSIWYVCFAVLGLDWMIPATLPHPAYGTVQGGAAWGEAMRDALGMTGPWDVLCVLGGNRSAKSELECFSAQASLMRYEKVNLLMFHTDSEMSRKIHQERMHRYLPPELKAGAMRGQEAYISYKKKTGFSDGTSYILPNGSECGFRNYRQERDKIEGEELGEPARERCLGFVADELMPRDWLDTLLLRLATRSSCGILGFTPIYGYTPTVGKFMDGARVLRYSKAFLIPRDGGKPERELALRMEACAEWVEYEAGSLGELALPIGTQRESWKSVSAEMVSEKKLTLNHGERTFAAVPRVIESADGKSGVICFHSDDNPFGNPSSVVDKVLGTSEENIQERYYGFTRRAIAGMFPLFSEKVHVVSADRIPEEGTNYHIVDPCGGRTWFQLWVRCTADRIYVYREWPSQTYSVPGQGFLGPWTLPSDDMKKLDGKMGPAQKNLGWGYCQYKAEVARLEGWENYESGANFKSIAKWSERCKKEEPIEMRLLDARFGNNKGFDEGGQLSMFERLDEIGLTFYESESGSRDSVHKGAEMINDALAYDTDRPVDHTNYPELVVSEDCKNLIFAMSIWTYADGQKGACKDPVDCLRMFFLKNCRYVDRAGGFGVLGGGGVY